MIAGIIPIAIAAIAGAYALLVIRAAPGRRDNMMFGALALTDASMTAWRGINVLSGDTIIANTVTLPGAFASSLSAIFTIDFVASFPRHHGMSWRWRTALITWGIVGGLVTVLIDWHGQWGHAVSEWVFFGPATLIVIVLGVRAWRLTDEPAARTVIVFAVVSSRLIVICAPASAVGRVIVNDPPVASATITSPTFAAYVVVARTNWLISDPYRSVSGWAVYT